MHPMTPDEVNDLLKATMHGPLPRDTMQRVFATLAAWAPILVACQATPIGAALERYEDFMRRAGEDDGYDVGEALEVMQQLADVVNELLKPVAINSPEMMAVAQMFNGCSTRDELAQALLVALQDDGLNRAHLHVLHKQVCERKGWE